MYNTAFNSLLLVSSFCLGKNKGRSIAVIQTNTIATKYGVCEAKSPPLFSKNIMIIKFIRLETNATINSIILLFEEFIMLFLKVILISHQDFVYCPRKQELLNFCQLTYNRY